MDANEFLRKVKPATRKSRLAPFLPDLLKLRQAGCTLDQLRDFLKANEVVISVAGLSAYLRRQGDDTATQKPPSPAKPAARSSPTPNPAFVPAETVPPAPEPDDAAPHLTLRQRGEAVADQYMTPAATNPLLKKLTKEKK